MTTRVALVSSERGLRVDPDLPIAAPALREAGLAVDLVRWDDPAVACSVDQAGETAMLFLGGHVSHAVRKGPPLRRGEGVRQDRDSRGDLRPVAATPEQPEVAQAVFDAVPQLVPGAAPVVYARIDLVADGVGEPVLLELELTEPSLFLPQAPPEALGRLTDAVHAALA